LGSMGGHFRGSSSRCHDHGRTISYLFCPYLISLDPITFCTILLSSASFCYIPYVSVAFQIPLLYVSICGCAPLMNSDSS
jgi:hypothetical protein